MFSNIGLVDDFIWFYKNSTSKRSNMFSNKWLVEDDYILYGSTEIVFQRGTISSPTNGWYITIIWFD